MRLKDKVAIITGAAAGIGRAAANIASNVASVAIRDGAAYVASKGAVAALTRAMALDHAVDTIRVNSVRALEARAPLNRMAIPVEIANMILWLASDEASFATGAMFTVDGGMSAW
jgi:NAD(P)-dependent dehydrogenase (short-subunit alcohol dehydrogenase family)